MNPQLHAIVEDLELAARRVDVLESALSHEQWTRRPGAGRWSPAECVAHLNLTSEAMLPLLHAALREAGRSQDTAARYRRDPVGWLMWKVLGPSSGLKTRTAPAFVPPQQMSFATVVADFERLQAGLIACVRAAEGLPIDRVKLVSPFDARVKYNLYAALTLVPRHQHRHLRQAEHAACAAVPGALPLPV